MILNITVSDLVQQTDMDIVHLQRFEAEWYIADMRLIDVAMTGLAIVFFTWVSAARFAVRPMRSMDCVMLVNKSTTIKRACKPFLALYLEALRMVFQKRKTSG